MGRAPRLHLLRGHRLEPLVVGLVAFGLYAATGGRDVLWGDPNKLTVYLRELEPRLSQWTHFGSLVWSWPFTWLPIEPYAWRAHLSSAVAAAGAVGFAHATLLGLGLDRRAARLGTGAFAVAHTPWFTASMMESYPVVLLAVAATAWLVCVRRRPLVAGIVLGFGALAHFLCLFSAPAAAFGLWRSRAGWPGSGVSGVARFALGLWIGVFGPGLWIALASEDAGGRPGIARVLGLYASLEHVGWNAAICSLYLAYNFVGLALVLLALGLWRLNATGRGVAVLLVLAHYGVALCWSPHRTFLIPEPLYLAAAYPIALAAQSFPALLARFATPALALVLAVPVGTYFAAPSAYARSGLALPMRDAPLRDEGAYFFRPWKAGERSARELVDEVDRHAAQGALVVGDFTTLSPLRYARAVEGWREDLELLGIDHRPAGELREQVIEALKAERPVLLLDAEVARALGELPAAVEHRASVARDGSRSSFLGELTVPGGGTAWLP